MLMDRAPRNGLYYPVELEGKAFGAQDYGEFRSPHAHAGGGSGNSHRSLGPSGGQGDRATQGGRVGVPCGDDLYGKPFLDGGQAMYTFW
jgi:hypothetical protein